MLYIEWGEHNWSQWSDSDSAPDETSFDEKKCGSLCSVHQGAPLLPFLIRLFLVLTHLQHVQKSPLRLSPTPHTSAIDIWLRIDLYSILSKLRHSMSLEWFSEVNCRWIERDGSCCVIWTLLVGVKTLGLVSQVRPAPLSVVFKFFGDEAGSAPFFFNCMAGVVAHNVCGENVLCVHNSCE